MRSISIKDYYYYYYHTHVRARCGIRKEVRFISVAKTKFWRFPDFICFVKSRIEIENRQHEKDENKQNSLTSLFSFNRIASGVQFCSFGRRVVSRSNSLPLSLPFRTPATQARSRALHRALWRIITVFKELRRTAQYRHGLDFKKI